MCIKHQLNEIIEILKDNNISNIIALVSTIIALAALIVTIASNNKNNKRYIDSLKPLLSFEFYQINGMLILAIKNTGMSEAKNINLKIKKLKNNGDNNKLMLDDLFKSEFMLYPTEEVQGIIGIYGERIDKEVFPMLDIEISYIEGNDNKNINYSRTIFLKKNIYGRNHLSRIEDSIESISYSNNRLANYIEGRTLFAFDRINVFPHNSLYKDMKDAINNVDRPEDTENIDDVNTKS
ncbi:MAG: hypothetical protein IJO33_01480 [Bacilli bacterium]|nr:hypothetical protein [Bacilli bacterium]